MLVLQLWIILPQNHVEKKELAEIHWISQGHLKKTSSKLCFRWWRLPHAFFLNTSPVYFFRGYPCLFSFFRHSYNVRWKWNKWGILLEIIEPFLSESFTLHQLYKKHLQPKISVKFYPINACVCLRELVHAKCVNTEHMYENVCFWHQKRLTMEPWVAPWFSTLPIPHGSWREGRICLSFGRLHNRCPPSLHLSSLHLK